MKKFKCTVADRTYIISAADAESASKKARIADMKTQQGYKVLYLGATSTGIRIAIIKRDGMSWGTDYIVAWNYDTASGTWSQGHYDFKSEKSALDYARDEYKIDSWQRMRDSLNDDFPGTVKIVTVQGQPYKVWGDFIDRATYAESPSGEKKRISSGGYISNELTIRKAIAQRFGLSSFRA